MDDKLLDHIQRTTDHYEVEFRQLQETEAKVSLEFARVLSVVHGGAAVSLIAWLQKIDPGSRWERAAQDIRTAFYFALLGLVCAVGLYLVQLLVLHSAATALLHLQQRNHDAWLARQQGRPTNLEIQSSSREESLRAGEVGGLLEWSWKVLAAFSILAFVAGAFYVGLGFGQTSAPH